MSHVSSCRRPRRCRPHMRSILRRSGSITIVDAHVCQLSPGTGGFTADQLIGQRRFVSAEFRTVDSASTPGTWTICLNHTGVGSAPESQMPKNSKVRFKQRVLGQVLHHATAGASTLGIVMGDLNLKPAEVDVPLEGCKASAQIIEKAGGTGSAHSHVPCTCIAFAPLWPVASDLPCIYHAVALRRPYPYHAFTLPCVRPALAGRHGPTPLPFDRLAPAIHLPCIYHAALSALAPALPCMYNAARWLSSWIYIAMHLPSGRLAPAVHLPCVYHAVASRRPYMYHAFTMRLAGLGL